MSTRPREEGGARAPTWLRHCSGEKILTKLNWLTRTNSIEWLSEHTEENTNFPSPNVEPGSPPIEDTGYAKVTGSPYVLLENVNLYYVYGG
jgi:hypothetical protein